MINTNHICKICKETMYLSEGQPDGIYRYFCMREHIEIKARWEKMNKDNFIIQTKSEPKKTDKRFNVLLKLSELRKYQVLKGNVIKSLREDLMKEKEMLKETTEEINQILDDLQW